MSLTYMANKLGKKKLPFGVKCAPLKSDRTCYSWYHNALSKDDPGKFCS